jgi:dihydrofolate synthase/folylpolyglutamate synthase
MNYKEATAFISEALPMFQRIGSMAYRADLNNAHILDKHFGYPHLKVKTIHVAGTNGKGSVSHMLASVLQCAGYRTGLFTSPHLLDFRERIRVNGKMITKSYVAGFITENQQLFKEVKPSFFEMSVFLAFTYFIEKKVDIALIEVGLGGRLDTTNIITPMVSVITNIGYDHTQILGKTLAEIATEKAGIIKHGVPVVIGETHIETKPIFENVAREFRSKICFADKECIVDTLDHNIDGIATSLVSKSPFSEISFLTHDLTGIYQKKNLQSVLTCISVLKNDRIINIEKEHIQKGLKNVGKLTGLRGRWQVVRKHPLVICDTAHNTEGFAEILRQIEGIQYNKLHMILGFVEDKNIEPILEMLPENAAYYLCQPSVQRARSVESLAETFRVRKFSFTPFKKVEEAVNAALRVALTEDLIYIGGSTFVVADFLAWKKKKNSF